MDPIPTSIIPAPKTNKGFFLLALLVIYLLYALAYFAYRSAHMDPLPDQDRLIVNDKSDWVHLFFRPAIGMENLLFRQVPLQVVELEFRRQG
jgi:hypothetical protein